MISSNFDWNVFDEDTIPNHTRISSVTAASSLSYASITHSYKDIKINGFPLTNNMKIADINLSSIMFLHEFDKNYVTIPSATNK